MRLSVPTIASSCAHFRRRLSFVVSSASSDASAARTFLKVRVNLRAFLQLQINLRQPRLVIDRHGGLVFLRLQDVVKLGRAFLYENGSKRNDRLDFVAQSVVSFLGNGDEFVVEFPIWN